MVEDDQVWLVKPIQGFGGPTHIRNPSSYDDIGQIEIISTSRIGGNTSLCADRGIAS
jgi:hypothetical protein